MLQKCDYLNDYSILVFKVKEGLAAGLTRRKAISKAVKDCIANGIMKGYLEFHAEEVFNMLELQWDRTAALQARYEEGVGIGRTQLKQLINFLMKNNKQEEIQIALNDDSKCNELLKKIRYYLKFHFAEVFDMLNLKWNREDALQAAYEYGYAVGFAEGLELGRKQFAKLLSVLIANGKQEEFQIALTDKSNRNEFYKKYDII